MGKHARVSAKIILGNFCEIRKASPAQLKDKFSLKYEPTQMTPVTLNQGSTVRVGTAAPVQNFNANGGGFQIELLNGQAQYGASVPLKKP